SYVHAAGAAGNGTSDWHSSMNVRALAGSRLATAARVLLPASRRAFQFFRAMFAVPSIPQRRSVDMMNLSCGYGEDMEGACNDTPVPGSLASPNETSPRTLSRGLVVLSAEVTFLAERPGRRARPAGSS